MRQGNRFRWYRVGVGLIVVCATAAVARPDALAHADLDFWNLPTLNQEIEESKSAGETIDEVGWLLAVLASACGADLLLARRERDGLAGVLAAVREAVRREGRELARGPDALPRLAPEFGDGWRVPWAIGTWIHVGAIALPERSSLEWDVRPREGGSEVRCRVPAHASRDALEQRVREHLPDAAFRRAHDEHALLLPRDALCWEREAS